MKLATTTGDFGRWTTTYEEILDLIRDAGFRYVDASISKRICANPDWRDEAKRVRDYAEELGLQFVQAHSPGGNALRLDKQDELTEITIRSIEICQVLGIPQTVVHAGYRSDLDRDGFYKENLAFYRRLFPAMEKTGVNVLIENTTKANLGENYYFYTGEQMVDFLRYANHPLLHAVWDTGHGNVEGNQYEQLVTLGKELCGIHVHDNSGRGDEHTLPYFGTMNMDDLMHGLLDANYQGCFTFEAICPLRQSTSHQGKRREFPQDTRLLEPTLEMQIDVERLLYTIGKHCLSAYGVFEE